MKPSFDISKLHKPSTEHVGYPYGMDSCIRNSVGNSTLCRNYIYEIFSIVGKINECKMDPTVLLRRISHPIYDAEIRCMVQTYHEKLENCINNNKVVAERKQGNGLPYNFDYERFRYNMISNGKLIIPK